MLLQVRMHSSVVLFKNADHQDGSSMEYTPPSSPVSGRYRNLGPELAATIPKRAIKSNWITGIKSRYNEYALRVSLDSDDED